MKLIFCKSCHDVRKLDYQLTYCKCGKCYGRYLGDGLNAEINKHAIPLGFNNTSLAMSIRNRPDDNWGEPFEAFVIQKDCKTVKIIEEK